MWFDFLKNGFLEEPDVTDAPKSYIIQDEWFEKLLKTIKGPDKFNWYAWYNIGNCYFARKEYEQARDAFEKSLELKASTWAYQGLGCAHLALGNCEWGAAALAKALKMNPTNLPFAKDAMRLCVHFKQYNAVVAMYGYLDDKAGNNPLILGYYAAANAYTGAPEITKEILERNGGLLITEIREGDDSVTFAYIHAIKLLAEKEGRIISDEDVKVPEKIDFRVFI